MEIQGVGGMDKDMQEIAAAHAALLGLKTQLSAYQSNPNDPNAMQNLIAAMKALTAASQLPLPPGQSYLSSELQSAVQLMNTIGSLPITIPSCSASNPGVISVRDNNGNPITLSELANHPEYTYNFNCRLSDRYDFKANDWATIFSPRFSPGFGPSLPPSVTTVSGVTGSAQDYTCHNYIDISASASGSVISSLGSVQVGATATNQISAFINSII